MNSLLLKNLIRGTKQLSFNAQNIVKINRMVNKQLIFMSQQQTRFFSSQMNDNEVIELVEGKVFEVLKSGAKCDHSKLSRTASFEELGFDSLDGVELVLAMEEHFGFDLSNQDAEKITSVMDAIQIFHSYYVKRLQPAETTTQQ